VSYQDLLDSSHYKWQPVTESDVEEILGACSDFDDWVNDDDGAWYAWRFARTLFEIPFDAKEVTKIKKWMSSREDFEEWVDHESNRRDEAQERYQY